MKLKIRRLKLVCIRKYLRFSFIFYMFRFIKENKKGICNRGQMRKKNKGLTSKLNYNV